MSITVTAFLTAALAEIRMARGGDVVGPDDLDLALTIFNEYLDALNADGRAPYTTAYPTFTLTPNQQPHTIGVAANTPNFEVTTGRPTQILAANLILGDNIRVPIRPRDDEWWMDLRARAITSTIPTDLLYTPAWPNGQIFLWPIPLTAYDIELLTVTLFAQVTSSDTIDLPFGYQQALRLSLAELLAPAFGQQVSPSTTMKAREARERIWGNNDGVPNLVTRDGGMPGGPGGIGGWSNFGGSGSAVNTTNLALAALTSDPVSPTDLQTWVLRVSTSPNTFQIRVRTGGVNLTIYEWIE